VGALQYFTWGGRTTKSLRDNLLLIVAVLCYGGPLVAIPLDELLVHSQTGHHGTDWERHLAILAWERGKLAEMIEVIQPLVLDGNP
ncbi:MAG TPA: hypothetical protein PKV72_03010, partial [Candidatus Peribacteria bacterium]|nr:hypothetical protein [Candidatus Peribacteria bacterium]